MIPSVSASTPPQEQFGLRRNMTAPRDPALDGEKMQQSYRVPPAFSVVTLVGTGGGCHVAF